MTSEADVPEKRHSGGVGRAHSISSHPSLPNLEPERWLEPLPDSKDVAPRDFEWLYDLDHLYKRELIWALGDELLDLGLTGRSCRDAPSAHNLMFLKDLAGKFAKTCDSCNPHPDENVAHHIKLMNELDFRLRQYEQVSTRARNAPCPCLRHEDCAASIQFEDSVSRAPRAGNTVPNDNGATDSSPAKSPEPAATQVFHIPYPSGSMQDSRLRIVVLCSLLTVLFLIGGMIGLYFAKESPKRVGLIVFLVTLLIILLALRRTRPIDIFLLAAAYAAVLVVFLNGDLAGPQQVVVVDIADGAAMRLAIQTTTVIPAQNTVPPSQVVSETTAVALTLMTVVVPTSQPLGANTLSSLTPPSPTDSGKGPTQTPTQTTGNPAISSSPATSPSPEPSPGYISAGTVAGIVIGCLVGVIAIVAGGVWLNRFYHIKVSSEA